MINLLSTTQVVTAGVMGVGGAERKALVNWKKVIEISLPGFLPSPAPPLSAEFCFFFSNYSFKAQIL